MKSNDKPMSLNVTQASSRSGKQRSTIYRHIKSGKLSATRTPGGWLIDEEELYRVYGATPSATPQNVAELHQTTPSATPSELAILREKVEMLERLNESLAVRAERAEAQVDRLLPERTAGTPKRRWWQKVREG